MLVLFMFSTIVVNCLLVSIVVLIHYEALSFLSIKITKANFPHRFRLILGVFGALCAHSFEIWIFAIAYFFMLKSGEFGILKGDFNGSMLDCSYYSFIIYSSLGLGDIAPFGYVRFVTGMESLTGLVLISWTASFLFIEMQKLWNHK
jgi:hypothetical protein